MDRMLKECRMAAFWDIYWKTMSLCGKTVERRGKRRDMSFMRVVSGWSAA